MANGLMERMRSAVSHRGEKLVARFSQRALDALEAVERVEGRLARTPGLLRELRTRATSTLGQYARRVRPDGGADAKGPDGAPAREEVEAPGPGEAREASPAEKPQAARRKTVPSSVAAKRSGRPGGFKVKRGQKHHPH